MDIEEGNDGVDGGAVEFRVVGIGITDVSEVGGESSSSGNNAQTGNWQNNSVTNQFGLPAIIG